MQQWRRVTLIQHEAAKAAASPPGHCAKPSIFRVAPSCLGVDLETFLGEVDQQFPSYLSSLAISGTDLLEVPTTYKAYVRAI